MSDSTFRTKAEPAAPEVHVPIEKSKAAIVDTKVDPPYLDWERETGKPYIVEYFGLGDLWKERVGGFEDEIKTINTYIRDEIEQGRLDNDSKAVKELLKRMEKQMGADKTDRTTMKIEQMAAFAQFLYKTRDIKNNMSKYGHQ